MHEHTWALTAHSVWAHIRFPGLGSALPSAVILVVRGFKNLRMGVAGDSGSSTTSHRRVSWLCCCSYFEPVERRVPQASDVFLCARSLMSLPLQISLMAQVNHTAIRAKTSPWKRVRWPPCESFAGVSHQTVTHSVLHDTAEVNSGVWRAVLKAAAHCLVFLLGERRADWRRHVSDASVWINVSLIRLSVRCCHLTAWREWLKVSLFVSVDKEFVFGCCFVFFSQKINFKK